MLPMIPFKNSTINNLLGYVDCNHMSNNLGTILMAINMRPKNNVFSNMLPGNIGLNKEYTKAKSRH